ncbi:hypothetical protein [Rathayibacter rathayi]|nr:hypothetical protein [Rathayibacter rathayi]
MIFYQDENVTKVLAWYQSYSVQTGGDDYGGQWENYLRIADES